MGGGAVSRWGDFAQAAAVLFLAGFLDMADGQVARRVGRVTAFGAFLDSTLDRYSDLALYMGLVVYYTLIGRPFYMMLAAVAMASSFMVSYSRARAESLIPSCKVGFMERPERLVLLILGGVFNRMAPGAVGDRDDFHITVIHRVVYTWQELRAGRSLPDAERLSDCPDASRASFIERFFHRRGNDILHALAQRVHIRRARPARVDRVVQIHRDFSRMQHPVARLKKLVRADDAHRHDRHAKFLREIENPLLEWPARGRRACASLRQTRSG